MKNAISTGIIAGWMFAVASWGCVGHARSKVAPAPVAAQAGATADETMRRALASALQAQGRDAVTALRALSATELAPRYIETRNCMLERLGSRVMPAIAISDDRLARVLATYREYWMRALRSEYSEAQNEAWLLDGLNAHVKTESGTPASGMDELEPALEALIKARGYHVLLGTTSPLRELMLWRNETETHYDVVLPEGKQGVTVVFMEDFESLGWAGFATCDRHHSGGWTKPDRLYAVRSAYDLGSEDFRVSYLAHEAQHFQDGKRFGDIAQNELEYRAKLVELAVAETTLYELLEAFAGNMGDDISVPHSYANGRVIRDARQRLFPGATGLPVWRDAGIARIHTAVTDLLHEDSVRLERAQHLPRIDH